MDGGGARVGVHVPNDFSGKVCSPSGTPDDIPSRTLFRECTRGPCKCTVYEALGAITVAAVSAGFIVRVSDLWGCSSLVPRGISGPIVAASGLTLSVIPSSVGSSDRDTSFRVSRTPSGNRESVHRSGEPGRASKCFFIEPSR